MQSEIKELKDGKLKLQKQGGRNNSNKNKKTKKKEKKAGDDKYAWKNKPPKEGAPTTRQWGGKTYHWCTHHNDGKGKWVLHKPSECNHRPGNGSNTVQHQAAPATADDASSSAASSTSQVRQGTTFAAAAAAIRELNDDEE